MRNESINPSHSTNDPSKALIDDVLEVMNSDEGFDGDSDTGLDLIQRFRELTRNDQYSSREIVFDMLHAYNRCVNRLCDKYEATLEDVEHAVVN